MKGTLLALGCLLAVLRGAEADVLTSGGTARVYSSILLGSFRILDCDDCASIFTMPFTMKFGSRSTNSVLVSSNGVLSLDSSIAGWDNGCCSPLSLLTNSTLIPRIALMQTDLAPNMAGAVYFRCSATSCTFSFEDVGVKNRTGTAAAQMELFSTGTVELRYGASTIAGGFSFAAGLQDENQGIRAGATLSACTVDGVCGADGFPANQGVRFTWLDMVNISTAQTLVANLAFERSRATSTLAALNTTVTGVQTSLAVEISTASVVQRSLAAAINKEVSRAFLAETNILLQVTSEVIRAVAAESSINSAITMETSRAMQAEGDETYRAMDSETALQGNIDFLTAAVTNLNARLSSEVSRATMAVTNETSRAIRAEALLGVSVSGMAAMWSANTTALLATYSTMLVSNAADNSRLSTSISGFGANASTAQALLAQAISDNSAAMQLLAQLLSSALAAEQTRASQARATNENTANNTLTLIRSAADASNTQSVSLAASLQQANITLGLAIDAAVSQATIDKLALGSALASESSRAQLNEAAIVRTASTQLASETSRAVTAEQSLATAAAQQLASATLRAQQVEASLAASLSDMTAVVGANISGLNQQARDQSAAIVNLGQNIASQAVSATAQAAQVQQQAQATYTSVEAVGTAQDSATRQTIAQTAAQLLNILSTTQAALVAKLQSETSRAAVSEAMLNAALQANSSSITQMLSNQAASLAAENQRAGQTEASLAMVSATAAGEINAAVASTSNVAQQQAAALVTLAGSVSAAVDSERVRALTAESNIDNTQAELSSSVQSNQANLSAAMATEQSRATTVEQSLASVLLAVDNKHQSSKAVLLAQIDGETSRAVVTENNLLAAISTGAQTAEDQLTATQATLQADVSTASEGMQTTFSTAAAAQQAAGAAAMAALGNTLNLHNVMHINVENNLSAGLGDLSARMAQSSDRHSNAIAGLEATLTGMAQTLGSSLQATAASMNAGLSTATADSQDTETSLAASIIAMGTDLSTQVQTGQATLGEAIEQTATELALNVTVVDTTARARDAVLMQTQSAAVLQAMAAENNLAATLAAATSTATAAAQSMVQQQQNIASRVMANEVTFSTGLEALDSSQRTSARDLSTAIAAMSSVADTALSTMEVSFARIMATATETASTATATLLTQTSTQTASVAALQASTAQALSAQASGQQVSIVTEQSRAQDRETSLAMELANGVAGWTATAAALDVSLSVAAQTAATTAVSMQQQYDGEKARRLDVEASLQARTSTTAASLTASIISETSRAVANEQALQTGLGAAVMARGQAVQTLASQATTLGEVQTQLQANMTVAALDASSAQAALEASLAVENTRARAEEAALAVMVANETQRALTAETSEQQRASASEAVLSAALQQANMSAWEGMSAEQVRASQARAQLNSQLSTTAAQTATAASILQTAIATLATQTNATAQQLAAMLAAESSRATATEASLGSAIATLAANTSTALEQESARTNTSVSALATALAAEASRATASEDNLTATLTQLAQSAQSRAQNVLGQLQDEVSRAQASESALLQDMATSVTLLTAITNSSVTMLGNAVQASQGRMDALVSNVTAQVSAGQSSTAQWQAQAAAAEMTLDRFLGEQPEDSASGWTVQVVGAIECTTCVTARALVCMSTTALAALRATTTLANGSKVEGTFAYRVYLLKTRPELFSYGGDTSLLTGPGLASMTVTRSAANASCLDVVATPTVPALVVVGSGAGLVQGQGRRRTGSNATAADLLHAINTTMSTQQGTLVWSSITTGAGRASTGAATGGASSSGVDTVTAILIVWNAILTLIAVVMLVVAWRMRRAQRRVRGGINNGSPATLSHFDALEYGDMLQSRPSLLSVGYRAKHSAQSIFLPAESNVPSESHTDKQLRTRDLQTVFESNMSESPMATFYSGASRAHHGLDVSAEEPSEFQQSATEESKEDEAGGEARYEFVPLPDRQGADEGPEYALATDLGSSLTSRMPTDMPTHMRQNELLQQQQQKEQPDAGTGPETGDAGQPSPYALPGPLLRPQGDAGEGSEGSYATIATATVAAAAAAAAAAVAVAVRMTATVAVAAEEPVYTLPQKKKRPTTAWEEPGSDAVEPAAEEQDPSADVVEADGEAEGDEESSAPGKKKRPVTAWEPPVAPGEENDGRDEEQEAGQGDARGGDASSEQQLPQYQLALNTEFDELPAMYTSESYSALLGGMDEGKYGADAVFRETNMEI